ncbi:MAG: hypothetical protein PHH22_00630 [Clostridia bacterium]|nr:hypothetical protein [Clostridia bacterium]
MKKFKASIYKVEQQGEKITLYFKGKTFCAKLQHDCSDPKEKVIIHKLLSLCTVKKVQDLIGKEICVFIDIPKNNRFVAYTKCNEPNGIDLITGKSCSISIKRKEESEGIIKQYVVFN